MVVGADHNPSPPSKSRDEVLVIVRIVLDRLHVEVPVRQVRKNPDRGHSDLDLIIGTVKLLTKTRIKEDSTEFLQDRCREDKFEAAIFKKLPEDLTRGALGANKRARQDVGVEDRSKHGLPALRLPGAVLGLVGEGVHFLLGKCRLLPGKGIEKSQPGE